MTLAWRCFVESVEPDGFWARLTEASDGSPDEEALMRYSAVPEWQLDRVKPGAWFTWQVGDVGSVIEFDEPVPFTEEDIQRAREWAERMRGLVVPV